MRQVIALIGVCLQGGFAVAEPPAPAAARPQRETSQVLNWIRLDVVQDDLDLTDEQLTTLQGMARQESERLVAAFRDIQSLSPSEREERAKQNTTAMESANRAALGILLPHQRKRLRQIELQAKARFAPDQSTFGVKEVRDALNLTEKQTDEIAEKTKAVREKIKKKTDEFQAALTAIRNENLDSLRTTMSAEQYQEFMEIHGRPFPIDRLPSVTVPAAVPKR